MKGTRRGRSQGFPAGGGACSSRCASPPRTSPAVLCAAGFPPREAEGPRCQTSLSQTQRTQPVCQPGAFPASERPPQAGDRTPGCGSLPGPSRALAPALSSLEAGPSGRLASSVTLGVLLSPFRKSGEGRFELPCKGPFASPAGLVLQVVRVVRRVRSSFACSPPVGWREQGLETPADTGQANEGARR